jgi:hypothetical protein
MGCTAGPALSNKFSGHRFGDFGKPPPDFYQTRSTIRVPQFLFDRFDVIDSQA